MSSEYGFSWHQSFRATGCCHVTCSTHGLSVVDRHRAVTRWVAVLPLVWTLLADVLHFLHGIDCVQLGLGGWWRGETRGGQRSGCQFRTGPCEIAAQRCQTQDIVFSVLRSSSSVQLSLHWAWRTVQPCRPPSSPLPEVHHVGGQLIAAVAIEWRGSRCATADPFVF
jgi:hypothetical protein